jgi:signal transduction histidine kinase
MRSEVPTISLKLQLRLLALALGLGLIGALIVAVTVSSQRQADEVRAHLSQLDLESFSIGEHFRTALRGVIDKMRAYRTTGDPPMWQEFLHASSDLKVWVDHEAPALTTEREKDVLKEIGTTYQDYLRVAGELHGQIQTLGQADLPRNDVPELIGLGRRLGDLGQALSRAHYESRNEVAARAGKTLAELRLSVLGLLALLFVFGIALAAVVYRQMLGPLRVKLGESIALAERNEKLASLGMLAAGVAHEIRTPLTAIKAALFIQQKRFLSGSPERADSDLVHREIGRLEGIVNDFLQFARPADPELAVVSAELPLHEVHGLLAAQLAKSGIELVCEPSPPLKIKVDPAQIKQVLINLVQNAADSMQDHGTITLRARHDRQHISNGELDVVVLEVADTGEGISPEVQKRLFDPFFTTKARGTGLGLPIAARIVEKHGGALRYRTELNHGSTFHVVLPQVRP